MEKKLVGIAMASGIDLNEYSARISKLPHVKRMILFGSYAKGMQNEGSDVDLAVFFDTEDEHRLEEYRSLVKIVRNSKVDVQVQVFSVRELDEPVGIVGEIVEYGIDIPLKR